VVALGRSRIADDAMLPVRVSLASSDWKDSWIVLKLVEGESAPADGDAGAIVDVAQGEVLLGNAGEVEDGAAYVETEAVLVGLRGRAGNNEAGSSLSPCTVDESE